MSLPRLTKTWGFQHPPLALEKPPVPLDGEIMASARQAKHMLAEQGVDLWKVPPDQRQLYAVVDGEYRRVAFDFYAYLRAENLQA